MIHRLLKNRNVVLASASPRRMRIFDMIGVPCLQKPANIAESNSGNNPRLTVLRHAGEKAEAVHRLMDPDCVVIGADTVVFLDGEILGKPEDQEEAFAHLRRLSGQTHLVYSGVCVQTHNWCRTGYEKTRVRFRNLSDEEIVEYLKTREPMDKAGAYGIQGYGSQFIEKITGCYFTVMGFPVSTFYTMLQELPPKRRT